MTAKFSLTPLPADAAQRVNDLTVSPSLTVRLYEVATWSVVEVHGEVDLRVRQLFRALPVRDGSRVVFDLRRVTFMDCSGVGVLAASTHLAARASGCVRVAGAPAQVRRLLALTHVERVLSLYDSLEEALAEPA